MAAGSGIRRAFVVFATLMLAALIFPPVTSAAAGDPEITLSRSSGPAGFTGVLYPATPCPAPPEGYQELAWSFFNPVNPDAYGDDYSRAVSTDDDGVWQRGYFSTYYAPVGQLKITVKCAYHRPHWSGTTPWSEMTVNKTYEPVYFSVTRSAPTATIDATVLHRDEYVRYTGEPCPLGADADMSVYLVGDNIGAGFAVATPFAKGQWSPAWGFVDSDTKLGRYRVDVSCTKEIASGREWYQYQAPDVDIVDGPPARHRFKYVALGDSYSAGEGVTPYYEPGNECDRSRHAYATSVIRPGSVNVPVLDGARRGTAQWGFQACSGAETGDVLDTGQHGDPLPQLALNRARDRGNANDLPVDRNTDMVTITIGGNDVGFAKILQHCYRTADCVHAKFEGKSLYDYVTQRFRVLGPQLDRIFSRIHSQAPDAMILALGYPQLFPRLPQEQNCGKLSQKKVGRFTLGVSQPEQNFLRGQTSRLNQVIADHARQATSTRFVPVDRIFAGHEVCGNSGEWINGPGRPVWSKKFPFVKLAAHSFHPNPTGQAKGYAEAVNVLLRGW